MNLPIQVLDNDGLRTLVSLIRRLFATKEELEDMSSSQTIINEIDSAVQNRIDYRISSGDISRIQASVTDDNNGNATIVFDATESTLQSYVEQSIANHIQSGDISRMQASITDDNDGNLTMSFETIPS